MQTEFEATFINIDKDELRTKLRSLGAELTKPETFMTRVLFTYPEGHPQFYERTFVRVRDEGDRVTMTAKNFIDAGVITGQKEAEVIIDDFDKGVDLLEMIGCKRKSFHESKREIWELDGVEVMLDERPFLEPYVEIEGMDEDSVRAVSEKLGFDYTQALFDSTSKQYVDKYGVSMDFVNNQISEIRFDMEENPFLSGAQDE